MYHKIVFWFFFFQLLKNVKQKLLLVGYTKEAVGCIWEVGCYFANSCPYVCFVTKVSISLPTTWEKKNRFNVSFTNTSG